MARVNVDTVAFTDPRFAHLGLILLGPDLEHAPLACTGIGAMAYVWNECTERATTVLQVIVLDMIGMSIGVTRCSLSKAIVQCGLGEKARGGIRIKGTTDRPPDWQDKLKESNRIRKQRQREREASVTRDNGVTSHAGVTDVTGPLTLTLTQALDPEIGSSQESEGFTSGQAPTENILFPGSQETNAGEFTLTAHANGNGKTERKKAAERQRQEQLEAWFVKFYEAWYPRHIERANAWKAFQKLSPTRETMQAIRADIQKRLDDGVWNRFEQKHIPYPATYLNRKGWI